MPSSYFSLFHAHFAHNILFSSYLINTLHYYIIMNEKGLVR